MLLTAFAAGGLVALVGVVADLQACRSTPTPTTTPAMPPRPVEFATLRTTNSTLDADHDDGLAAKYRRIEDLLGGGKPLGLAVRELEEEVAELQRG